MTKNYTHLSIDQRYQIEALLKTGIRQKDIADILDVHPSTVSRELRRNVGSRGPGAGIYRSINAQRRTDLRHQEKPKKLIFTQTMKDWVVYKLKEDKWSPELISQQGRKTGECPLSHEWIYQWIWECKHSNRKENQEYKQLYTYLKHGKRRRKRGNRKDRRGIIPHRVSIEQRPQLIGKRERLGDIEVDLMMGKNHKGSLLVMTDRASLFTRIRKMPSKNADQMAKAIVEELSKDSHQLETLTFDNDMAFSKHELIAQCLKVDTYFTRPYTSQDKGTVENRIGVIRRFFPKKTDLRFVSEEQIKVVANKINERPIRKFNYLNAKQVLQRKIALIT
jgi:IS30 family transposase